MNSTRESTAEMFLGFAIGALLSGGHSLRSARDYLARRIYAESEDIDDPVAIAVRGSIAAITEVLGAEVDIAAFVLREQVWRIFESGEIEAITRDIFSRVSSERIITEYKRATRPQLRLIGGTMKG